MTNSLNSLTVRENHVFKKNDFVRIINDQNRVKRLQRGHGEWADVMIKSLNKIGKIIDIYHDDDLKVLINGSFWTYNPQAVRFVFSFSTSGMISQLFIDEIVTIIRESNSPIDELWEGILKSDIDLGKRFRASISVTGILRHFDVRVVIVSDNVSRIKFQKILKRFLKIIKRQTA